MREWEYKTRSWSVRNVSQLDGKVLRRNDIYSDIRKVRANKDTVSEELIAKSKIWVEKCQKFEDWLNWQSTGGWEVIKISRDWKTHVSNDKNSKTLSTWCVFKRAKED